MSEVKYMDHKGRQILLIDFSSGHGPESLVETGEKAMHIVRSSGKPHSILGLLDLSGTRLTKTVRNTMKRMSKNNGPYMKSVAFVGMGMVLTPFLKGVLILTKRKNHRVFHTREEALNWLGKH